MEMPQTIQDGEHFGKGDTGFKSFVECVTGKKKRQDEDEVEANVFLDVNT